MCDLELFSKIRSHMGLQPFVHTDIRLSFGTLQNIEHRMELIQL